MNEPEQGGPLEYRTATLADVNFPRRTIDLIVMPYEQEALVVHQGRVITEVCSRGAYDGIQARTTQVKVNRDHDVTRTIGKALRFHPSRSEGLVAELRIAKTELGEETLALAEEEILDASAGFALLYDQKNGRVYPDAETWETEERRRLNRLYLGHIALTPDPAYTQARVLAVRTASVEEPPPPTASRTPNLDQVRAWLLEDRRAIVSPEL